MKKKIVAIMACAMMLLSVGASAEMTAGTYTGEGQGIGGAVKGRDRGGRRDHRR